MYQNSIIAVCGVDRKGAGFIGNKHTNRFTHSHIDTQLYILVPVHKMMMMMMMMMMFNTDNNRHMEILTGSRIS